MQRRSNTVLGRAHLAPFGSGSHIRGIPGDYYSPSRFVRATTYSWNTYEDPAIHSVAMADYGSDGTELTLVGS